MRGRLYVVSTPIGNLQDVTLRALEVLGRVSLIAAEDTRRTRRLLAHAGIGGRLTSLHGHNEARASARVLGELASGHDVALVSDAGTPLLSDPGHELVRRALAAGARVEPIPGPSAVLAALVMSGLPAHQFTFLGFPPARGRERRVWFETLAAERRTVVCFEAPHRIRATLEEMARHLGDGEVAVCREVTKIHEELVKGPISRVLGAPSLQAPRGEFVIVLDLAGRPDATAEAVAHPTDEEVAREFGRITETEGLARRPALAAAARRYGISQNEAYAAVERVKRRSRERHV